MHTGDLGPRNLPATPPEVTSQALDMLDEGDIVDHVFGPLTGGVVDQNMQVLPALRAAKERGVYLNTAVGDYQFGWAQADALLAQGPPVDFIASDIEIHSGNPNVGEVMVADGRTTGARVAFGQTLVEYMASFLKLGFSLDEVIRMATAAPAKAMGIEDTAGSLKVGLPADIVVLELLEGHFKLTDATGVSRVGNLALVPVVTLKAGTICPVSSGTHDWGFAPPRATAEEVAALA